MARRPPQKIDSSMGASKTASGFGDLSIAVAAGEGSGSSPVTARLAGGLIDLRLPVSPRKVALKTALHNMAKAINVALQEDFLVTSLEPAYRVARVSKGTVCILHRDYIGLGDSIFAKIGKAVKSFTLTLQGPDPASPEGRRVIQSGGGGSLKGIFNLLGRKLDLIQEYEDMVPDFVEQMLDRLESTHMITGWSRSEWTIETTKLGLDIVLTPDTEDAAPKRPSRKKKLVKAGRKIIRKKR